MIAAAADAPKMKPKMEHKNGIWVKILIPIAGLAVAGGVAWGVLRQEVTGLHKQGDLMYPKVTENCKDVAVLTSQLSEMNRKLDRILEKIDK